YKSAIRQITNLRYKAALCAKHMRGSSPRVSGGRMPPELADKMSAPHFQTGSNSMAALAVMLIVSVFYFASTSGAAESAERKQPGKLTSLQFHVQTPSKSEASQTL